MKNSSSNSSRRQFIKKSATTAFGFTFIPAYLTSGRAAGNPKLPPSQRLNLACIGAGGRASQVISSLCGKGAAQPIALVDVDFKTAKRVGQTLKAYPDAKQYNDFRKMFDEMADDIDAVSVATPDHTHFVAAIQAMSLGKHVYVEKPLTHTFEESEILMRAEKKYKVVTQMGNQGHTSAGSEQFKQLLAAGIVDDVVKIEAWKSPSLWFMKEKTRFAARPQGETMPESLKDWDLWCGPCGVQPYSSMLHPFGWRAFHQYGSGMFGDWGCHIVDYIHHYLRLGLPTKINPIELGDHNTEIFPISSDIEFEFAGRGEKLPPVSLHWKAGGKNFAPIVDKKYGDPDKDGNLKSPNPGNTGILLHRKQEDYLVQRAHHESPSRIFPRAKMLDFKEFIKATPPELDHFQSFVQACMGNTKTESPFSVGGELTQFLNIGMIAEYLNVELNFDPKTKRFIDNDKANFLLAGPPPRDEWAGHYKLA